MDKIALVTGAGSGIGKAAALALMGEGYALILAGRRAEPLEEVAREGDAMGVQTLAVATDVGDPQAVEALFAKTKERFGRLDLLFNNAGIGTRGTLLEELPPSPGAEPWPRDSHPPLARDSGRGTFTLP